MFAVEPDAPVLRVMGLNMLDARRIDDIEELAHRRALGVLAAHRGEHRQPPTRELAAAVVP